MAKDMLTQGIGHISTAAHAALFNPFQVPVPPSANGVPLGNLIDGQPFYFDPHQLKIDGDTEGMIINAAASRDTGKTTLAIAYWNRRLTLSAGSDLTRRFRVSADDGRRNAGEGEYERFAAYHGCPYYDLSKAHLNMLDSRMKLNIAEQTMSIEKIIGMTGGTQPDETALMALQVALNIMNEESPEDSSPQMVAFNLNTMVYDDYIAFMTARANKLIESVKDPELRERMRARLNLGLSLSEREFMAGAAQMGTALTLLLEGRHGSTFGGSGSIYEIMNQQVVALNYSGLNDQTHPLVEFLVGIWRNSAVRRHDPELMSNGEMMDEAWRHMRSVQYGRNLIARIKENRGNGIIVWRNIHKLSDADSAGPEGSEQVELARTSLTESDIWFIGRTKISEMPRTQKFFGLSDEYAKRIPYYPKGRFLVKLGMRPPFEIDFQPTPDEIEMTKTNRASEDMAANQIREAV